jgi:carbon monoxide dehydrogenase subunit G
MARVHEEITIERSADDVWTVVGDPASIVQWVPGVVSCDVEGHIRTAVLGDRRFTEEFQVDHAKRRITYRIVEATGPAPLTSHEAQVAVTPSGTGCQVVYSHEFEPRDAQDRVRSSTRAALQSLQRLVTEG